MGIENAGPDRPVFRPSARALLKLPRFLAAMTVKLSAGKKIMRFIPVMQGKFLRFRERLGTATDGTDLLGAAEELYRLTGEAAYYNIVTPLVMQLFNALRSRLSARAEGETTGFDPTPATRELLELNPLTHLERLHSLFLSLPPEERDAISSRGYAAVSVRPERDAFRGAVEDFLLRFGHFSDSGNDFSVPSWKENPDLVIRMLLQSNPDDRRSPGEGSAPIDRAIPGSGGPAANAKSAPAPKRLPSALLPFTDLIRRQSLAFRILRERVSSLYTEGYGLFRDIYRALGGVLVKAGRLTTPERIFYLSRDEIEAAVNGRSDIDLEALAERRMKDLKADEGVRLPGLILGNEPPAIVETGVGNLQGIPTSIGRHTGRVRKVRGAGDMERISPGDVLVIPYSDVGLVTLFTRAGAVIAESGGVLSHSSIVAREFGIPAVVSVEGAMDLPEDALVQVDGYSGKITIISENEEGRV